MAASVVMLPNTCTWSGREGVELAQLTSRLLEELASVEEALRALFDAIRHDDLPVSWYVQGQPLVAVDAREAIIAHLSQFSFRQHDPDSAPDWPFGYVLASPGTLARAVEVNAAKARFKRARRAISALAIEGVISTHELLKQVKRHFPFQPVNFDSIDCKVPLFGDVATALNFYWFTGRGSERKTVADAVAVLEKMAKDSSHADAILREASDLSRLPFDTPVSYRVDSPITSVLCRVRLSSGGKRCYARNPIFLAAEPLVHPTVGTPGAAIDHVRQSPTNTPKINPSPLSPRLPQWHLYLQTEPAGSSTPASIASPKKIVKPHNPFASTAYPGLWLGMLTRQGKIKATVQFTRHQSSTSSVSIGRLTLVEAWGRACDAHVESFRGHKETLSLEDMRGLCPDQAQLDKALAWAESRE